MEREWFKETFQEYRGYRHVQSKKGVTLPAVIKEVAVRQEDRLQTHHSIRQRNWHKQIICAAYNYSRWSPCMYEVRRPQELLVVKPSYSPATCQKAAAHHLGRQDWLHLLVHRRFSWWTHRMIASIQQQSSINRSRLNVCCEDKQLLANWCLYSVAVSKLDCMDIISVDQV